MISDKPSVPFSTATRRYLQGVPVEIDGGTASIRSQVVQSLRAAIASGALPPGEKLSDARLCQELGISRTSVREALRYLEAEQLITVRSGRMMVSKTNRVQAETIYHMLGLLLGDAVAQLALRMSPENTTHMRSIHADLSRPARAGPRWEARLIATRFYALILEAIGNSIIRDVVQTLLVRSGFLRVRSLADEQRTHANIAELCAISVGILSGSSELARREAVKHFAAEGDAAAKFITAGNLKEKSCYNSPNSSMAS